MTGLDMVHSKRGWNGLQRCTIMISSAFSQGNRTMFRKVWLALVVVAILSVSLAYLNGRFPERQWVALEFAKIWAWQAAFCAAALSAGHLLLATWLRIAVPRWDHWVLAMAVGTVVFGLCVFGAGALGWLNPTFAVALPVLLIAIGLPKTWPALRSFWCQFGSTPSRGGPLTSLVQGFGVIATALVYLQCMTPDAINYDAAWCHLVVAQDYAREGRIVPFLAEAAKNLPHFHALLYTWGFLVPGFSDPALHWMMAQHLEFVLLLWTLSAVVPVVRWMHYGRHVAGAWAAFFLFPGIFVYDSNLGGAADHVAAFFALPFLLAALRLIGDFTPRLCVVAGLIAGGALHTKYQAMYLVVPVALVLLVNWSQMAYRNWWTRSRVGMATALGPGHFLAPLWCASGALLVLLPLFLKNLLFYKNPVYPFLQEVFTASWPSFPGSATLAASHLADVGLRAPGTLAERIVSSLKLMLTYSIEPQFSFAGKLPLSGSLFALSIPIVLFQARNRRLLLGFFLAQTTLFLWAMTYRVERNLQLLIPWMVAATAAALAGAWQSGWLARAALAPLVLLQVGWGAKYMVAGGMERTKSAQQLLSRDLAEGKAPFAGYRSELRALGEALPQDSLVLLHTAHLQLGINRTILSDWAGWQYLIDYRPLLTARDVYERYRALGITHLVWNNYDFPGMKQQDVLFVTFTRRHAIPMGRHGGHSVWKMPLEAPPREPPMQVVTVGLRGYPDGLYAIDKLGVFEETPGQTPQYPLPDQAVGKVPLRELLESADAMVHMRTARFDTEVAGLVSRCFKVQASYPRGGHDVLLRNAIACPKVTE